jgi:hypothetical protein
MLTQDQQSQIIEGVSDNSEASLQQAAETFKTAEPALFQGGGGGLEADGIDPDDLPSIIMPWDKSKLPTVNPDKPCDHVPGGIPFYNNNAGPVAAALSIIGADLKMHRLSGFIKDNTFLTLLAAQRGNGVTARDIYNSALALYKQQRKPLTRDQLIDL